MRWTIVIAIMAAACGGSTTGGIDAQKYDSVVTSTDAKAGIDGAPGALACGTPQAPTTCTLPTQSCCDFAPGSGTPYCFEVSGGVCEGGTPLHCDGPEDCTSGQRCCYKAGSGSTCTAGPDCAPGGSGGEIMCHVGDDTPCAPNGVCCELHGAGPSGGSVFGTCHVGACPV
ncbi:MAG TPA: hypothetical protein VL463_03035 [Kofleriaceae bacterium]|nr:hypothetical protein [Kofleriaceae bacterium]